MRLLLKLGILLAILINTLTGNAQSKSDKLYDTFSGKNGVTTFSFSKSVIEPFEIFLDNETRQVIYRMKKIRVMAYNENRGDLSSLKVYERIEKDLKNGSYFNIDPNEIDLIEQDHDDDHLLLIGHGHKNKMDEFHLIIYDNDRCFLFSFFGDISIDDLNKCDKFSNSARSFIDL
jgi:hypothetical protein